MKLLLLVAAVLVLAGCSAAAPDPGPRFDDEAQAEITCMKHQTTAPGPRYLDEQNWDTDMVFPLLRYYTVNGRKPYCDAKGPSDIDKAWAAVYVKLGADQANVQPLL